MPDTQAGDAVAQKAVLYEEYPSDPNGKRFVGSAIWRTENVMPDPGQPPELTIRADVEVPRAQVLERRSEVLARRLVGLAVIKGRRPEALRGHEVGDMPPIRL
jgi:hypothetical protein